MQGDAARVAAAVVEKFSTVYLADSLYWSKQLLISTLRQRKEKGRSACLSQCGPGEADTGFLVRHWL